MVAIQEQKTELEGTNRLLRDQVEGSYGKVPMYLLIDKEDKVVTKFAKFPFLDARTLYLKARFSSKPFL